MGFKVRLKVQHHIPPSFKSSTEARSFCAISDGSVEGACLSRACSGTFAKRASLTNLSITVWQPSGLSTFAPRPPTTMGIQLPRRSNYRPGEDNTRRTSRGDRTPSWAMVGPGLGNSLTSRMSRMKGLARPNGAHTRRVPFTCQQFPQSSVTYHRIVHYES